VGEVALTLLGGQASTHDAVAQREGAFDLVLGAIDNLRGLHARMEADVLVTTRSLPELADVVTRFAPLGVTAFRFWHVSLHGLDATRFREWVPRMTEVTVELERAFDAADATGVEATTYHTPPCVLPARHRGRYQHAGHWRLLVVVPGSEPFMAEQSPMEGGTYLETCGHCSARSGCLGLRADYLAVHGGEEFTGLP
jgi:MoaA/NifB/PqqE/SkfB family radical SAM enzyme